jgi:transaldolase
MMSKIHQLAELGQSIWLDYVSRDYLNSNQIQDLLDKGLRGMTSNPTIFEKAITQSSAYDADLKRLAGSGKTAQEIYESLVIADIQQAADLLMPVYKQTQGGDGYVSLEVNPDLAYDTEGTIDEVQRLWETVERPNLLIKIPATRQGIEAISESIQSGINVNVTLIFSLSRYGEVIAAYIRGLEMRHRLGEPINNIASVASFFVSRVDTKVDGWLKDLIHEGKGPKELIHGLQGQVAVANAIKAYNQFQAIFVSDQFLELQEYGGRAQRPLWASTSTKNPAYSDIKYVQELIAPHTVNTLPQDTLAAFLDHGEVRVAIDNEFNQADFVLQSLDDVGISLNKATTELEKEGVAKFADSYNSLLETIQQRIDQEI